jgi:hypothetical protein
MSANEIAALALCILTFFLGLAVVIWALGKLPH